MKTRLPYALARFGILLGCAVVCIIWLVVAFGGAACRFPDSRTTAAALGRPPASVPASSARKSAVISGTAIVTVRVATARPATPSSRNWTS